MLIIEILKYILKILIILSKVNKNNLNHNLNNF
jgi:hypothetical protein